MFLCAHFVVFCSVMYGQYIHCDSACFGQIRPHTEDARENQHFISRKKISVIVMSIFKEAEVKEMIVCGIFSKCKPGWNFS